MYKRVHTGANTHEGGLKKGFITVGNQVFTEDCVAKPERNPTNKQVKTDTNAFERCILFKI
ncbi:hypothetical protein GCM10023230_04330 [Flavobacterium hankyongi]|uniref:Uncharacterized protein n=1 Tax=Flavobacterium hankyongi TaxID=1176532 RepID=A0ABP8ZL96_9FLAO